MYADSSWRCHDLGPVGLSQIRSASRRCARLSGFGSATLPRSLAPRQVDPGRPPRHAGGRPQRSLPLRQREKYKRCCADKDQQRGAKTPFEILAGIGEGHARLRYPLVEQLRPSELARIDPAHVGTLDLISAIRRLSTHRRWDVVARFADELGRRTDLPGPVAGYHDEIAFDALEDGALDVALRHFELSEPDDEQCAVFELRLALARRSPDPLERLDRLVESGLRGNDAGPLIESAHAVLETHPALGILVARGAAAHTKLA